MNSFNARGTDAGSFYCSFLMFSSPISRLALRTLRFVLILACLTVVSVGSGVGQVQTSGLSVMEAVQAVLLGNPNLRLQEAQVQIAEGVKEQASGAFNHTLQAGINHSFSEFVPIVSETTGYAPMLSVTEISNITTLSVSSSKLYRSGINVAPSFQLQRTADSFLAPAGYNTQTSSLTITVPLLQGRGRQVVAARPTTASPAKVTTRDSPGPLGYPRCVRCCPAR